MNTTQIKEELKCLRNIYVAPRDCIPPITKFPAGLVINTDSHIEPGEHWVSVFIGEDRNPIYFDSFGLPPLHLDLIKFLNENSHSHWIYNKLTLQHPESKSCGIYCIQFLKDIFKSRSIEHFQSYFSSNLINNEKVLKILRLKLKDEQQ